MQDKYLKHLGSRFVFASDEFFCVSNEPLPLEEEYEGYPQYENGVGLLRSFKNEVQERLEEQKDLESFTNRIIFATGVLAFDFIYDISKLIMMKFKNLEIKVIPIKNKFFGETITVSGLITASDLVEQLSSLENYDYVLIPDSMLKQGEDVFLDNISLKDATVMLNKKIYATPVDGSKLIDIIEYGVE
jgi:NifB/MoaA-like Fe-S oxidoreductase